MCMYNICQTILPAQDFEIADYFLYPENTILDQQNIPANKMRELDRFDLHYRLLKFTVNHPAARHETVPPSAVLFVAHARASILRLRICWLPAKSDKCG